MAQEFKPEPPQAKIKAALAVHLTPTAIARLDAHAAANNLHRNKLATQILEWQIGRMEAIESDVQQVQRRGRKVKTAGESVGG